MREPGEPESSPPGLIESLVTLVETPGLHEPIIPGGTHGLSLCGSRSLFSDSGDMGSLCAGQDGGPSFSSPVFLVYLFLPLARSCQGHHMGLEPSDPQRELHDRPHRATPVAPCSQHCSVVCSSEYSAATERCDFVVCLPTKVRLCLNLSSRCPQVPVLVGAQEISVE